LLILLTNDDGVQADGLAALFARFHQKHEVYVVAPDRERSGSSHAITVFQPLMVHRARLGGVLSDDQPEAWAVVGTPVDCVKLAVANLLPRRPDLVISGINRGPNLGTDVFYSGTVSAAIEATLQGLPAIAVSLAAFRGLDYSFAAEVAEYVAEQASVRGIPPDTLLNVNVPAVDRNAVAGVRVTSLSGHAWHDTFEERADPRGRSYFWLVGEPITAEPEAGTDVRAIRGNYVSVTPVHLERTNRAIIAQLEGWGLHLGELSGREPEPKRPGGG
jgi:5'-nucleotidase